jgi:hypothetical protein
VEHPRRVDPLGPQAGPHHRQPGTAGSELFGAIEQATFTHWQQIDRKSIQDLVLSRSNVAVLDEEARAAKLAEVLAFYDEFGRGMDGMQLPYVTRCFRAALAATEEAADDEGGATGPSDGSRLEPATAD